MTYLEQAAPYDVASWTVDADFAIFPQGARAKEAVFAPPDFEDLNIIPGRRYLFKRSKKSYPDQFWIEVIAYRLGSLFGFSAPPTFVAYNSETGLCAALIQWFYNDQNERYIPGGDILEKSNPDFDRRVGEQHNVDDVAQVMRVLGRLLGQHEWREWWVHCLIFDTLIGNTDRHQENWGVIRTASEVAYLGNPKAKILRLSPFFDNGTSLGHERFPARVAEWSEADLDRYIQRGTHHLRWRLGDQKIPQLHLLRLVFDTWPSVDFAELQNRLAIDKRLIASSLTPLLGYDLPVPLTRERLHFTMRVFERRLDLVKELVDEYAPARV